MRRCISKRQTLVHVTSIDKLDDILQNGIVSCQIPISKAPNDRNSLIKSDLKGVVVNTYPNGYNILPYLTTNVFPVVLRLETVTDCEIYANDNYVRDEFIVDVPQTTMENALRDQAQLVLDLYGTTVLSSMQSNTWCITGMQVLDDCLLRYQDSPKLIKARQQLLDVTKYSYFCYFLRLPLSHKFSRANLEKSLELCKLFPFVPFNESNIDDVYSRNGGIEKLKSPSPPLFSKEELDKLRGPPQDVIDFIRSVPEPIGVKPPSNTMSLTTENFDIFDAYIKAKFLKKPPPAPPVTYSSKPRRANK